MRTPSSLVPCNPQGRTHTRGVRVQAKSAETGMVFIPPYDDPHIIAGQGTVGTELLRQLSTPDLDRLHAIFVAIGGGGLAAGIAAYVKALRPSVKIYGVEPSGTHAMLSPEICPSHGLVIIPATWRVTRPSRVEHCEFHRTWTACMHDGGLLSKAMHSRLLHYLALPWDGAVLTRFHSKQAQMPWRCLWQRGGG